MDQKQLVCMDKKEQSFNQALNSSKIILNDIQFAPILKTLKTELNKISDHIKDLVQKIGQISETRLEQENYFLYDNSNIINKTLYTKLNKNIQTSGLISYFNKNTENYSDLIILKNRLKFVLREDTLREGLSLQLESIRLEKAKIKKTSNTIRNFAILALKKDNPPGNKTSWGRRNDISLYIPATSQVRLKWITQWRLSGTLPRRLSSSSSQRLIGMLWRRLKEM